MDTLADNYDPIYNINSITLCEYIGCMEPLACNYDSIYNIYYSYYIKFKFYLNVIYIDDILIYNSLNIAPLYSYPS